MDKENSSKKEKQKKPEKLIKDKTASKAKTISTKDTEIEVEDGVLVETARRVETSARLLGDKTVEVVEKVSDQTTEIAEIALDKLKKGVSDAFERGSKTMSDMGKKAGKYVKKYEDTLEMKKLSHDRNKKMEELGSHIFNKYKSKTKNIAELINDEESQRLLSDIELLNKEVVKLGRRIKRKI
jgi:hypothetical protein